MRDSCGSYQVNEQNHERSCGKDPSALLEKYMERRPQTVHNQGAVQEDLFLEGVDVWCRPFATRQHCEPYAGRRHIQHMPRDL